MLRLNGSQSGAILMAAQARARCSRWLRVNRDSEGPARPLTSQATATASAWLMPLVFAHPFKPRWRTPP